MALGLAGLFIEAHPNPDEAKCDGPCALPLSKLEPYLAQMKAMDELVKGFAVGRTIFGDAARKWLAGNMTDDEAVADMGRRFGVLCKTWDEARQRRHNQI